ncbi:MAG TPA: rRNA maturation RNase YbeY [Acidimicrobiales bacterium]|nr:rRNA maturation RNase YbeY [Acidimicrobiales bacterium]
MGAPVSGPDGPRRRRRPGPPEGEVTVFVADEQAAAEVDVTALARLTEKVLDAEGVRGACELSLYFVEEDVIADANERFLGGRGPTDVLAFPIDDETLDVGRSPDAGSSGPDRPLVDLGEVPVLLGDLLVCPAVAARNASEHGRPLPDELALLVVHGILHVLGMDHTEAKGAAAMGGRQRDLLARFHPSTGEPPPDPEPAR